MMSDAAVLLVAHGTVDTIDELPEFLKNIRRGHPASPELLAEVQRRYRAIGGGSPLNTINRQLAARLEERLGVPVRVANRMFRPFPEDVLPALVAGGAKRVIVVPLAQHSAPLYGDAVKAAARDAKLDVAIVAAANWGHAPGLTEAFARSIVQAMDEAPPGSGEHRSLLLSAHSLPVSVIDAGDPYEVEFRASAEAVAARVRELATDRFVDHVVAFQSQGMSTGPGGRPMAWLGPDLRTSLEAMAARGRKDVLVAPIGFLADHVEILYDLDIEARGWAEELGLTLRRAPSLNAGDGIVGVLETLARALLAAPLDADAAGGEAR